MDVDDALLEAWNLGMDDSGWTDECDARADELVPILVDAGYVAVDGESPSGYFWRFTPEGVSRAETLDARAASDTP